MASFDEHISQARRNLIFLQGINENCNDHWDWQVTTCFYTAVHLTNAHISKVSGLHYRTHKEVKNALNPFNLVSVTKFPELEYTAYVKLMNLSRRARYLCHDDPKNKESNGFFTFDKHLDKSIKHLSTILAFIEKSYGEKFDKFTIKCTAFNKKTDYFSAV